MSISVNALDGAPRGWLQVLPLIHPLVEDADDQKLIARRAIEDQVTAHPPFSVAITPENRCAKVHEPREQVERLVDSGGIAISLILAPTLLAERPNADKVALGKARDD